MGPMAQDLYAVFGLGEDVIGLRRRTAGWEAVLEDGQGVTACALLLVDLSRSTANRAAGTRSRVIDIEKEAISSRKQIR